MNIDKQTFNTLDVLYDDKKWGKRIDPDEWNANFKVLEEGHNELAAKLNQQVADIDTAIQAATSSGGQNISVQYGAGTETLQDALDNVVSDINNRYTKNEVDASIGSNTNSLIANAEYNESTGVFTFTRKDGSSVVIDTVIEKVPASMALVNEPDGSVSLVVTNQDGSQTKTNVTSLIEDTVINSSDTVNATSVTDAVKKVTTYTLVIKPNSIGLSHIDSALTAKFEETQSAKTAAIQAKDNAVAAQNAAVSAKNSAETYASNANTYSTNASTSADESADSALEAKGYAEQAASYKNSAELAKIAAEKARDEAQAIAGGDFATKAELNNHINNTTLHLTADEKTKWNNKAECLNLISSDLSSATHTPLEIISAMSNGNVILTAMGGVCNVVNYNIQNGPNYVVLQRQFNSIKQIVQITIYEDKTFNFVPLELASIKTFSGTLGTSYSTADSSYYIQNVEFPEVTADDEPIIDLITTVDGFEKEQEEWNKIFNASTNKGYITFYASQPTTIPLNFNVKVVK